MIKNYFRKQKDFKNEFETWAKKQPGYISLDCAYDKKTFEQYVSKHGKSMNRVIAIWKGLFFQKCLDYLLEGGQIPKFNDLQSNLIAEEAENFYSPFSLRNDWKLIEKDYQITNWREGRTIDYIFYSKFEDKIILVNLKRSPYITESRYRAGSANMVSQGDFCLAAMKEHFPKEFPKMVYYVITTYDGLYETWTIGEIKQTLKGSEYKRWYNGNK